MTSVQSGIGYGTCCSLLIQKPVLLILKINIVSEHFSSSKTGREVIPFEARKYFLIFDKVF